MAISITPENPRIDPLAVIQFTAAGGVAPYTWEVLPGGIGGTIDVDGVYTSPPGGDVGVDFIAVTDSDDDSNSTTVVVDPVMSIAPSRVALGVGIMRSFLARGGTPPYTYLVEPNGAGGSIDEDGFYTAPPQIEEDPAKSTDTITATDSVGLQVQSTVLLCAPAQLVGEIIAREMNLGLDRIWLWDQKIDEPTDKELFIVISDLGVKPISSVTQLLPDGSELQTASFYGLLQIDIKSRNKSAWLRKEEILLALGSFYSQQQQSANSFYIARLPTRFVNLSEVDGAAIPYRFTISVGIQYMVSKNKGTDYYDDFQAPEVTVDP